MRIGGPAHRHGVTETDMLHATRNAVRRVVMDEDLTMLIGPAADGSLLEVGVLDLEGKTLCSSTRWRYDRSSTDSSKEAKADATHR